MTCVRISVALFDGLSFLLLSMQLRGKWVGTWKMSKGAEKLLKRMIAPNADLRCNATAAIADTYWTGPARTASHSAFLICRSEYVLHCNFFVLFTIRTLNQRLTYPIPICHP